VAFFFIDLSVKKKICILGSTGSIGTQALNVIAANADKFEVEILTANNNADLLIEQAIKFNANTVVIANKDKYQYVSDALDPHFIKVFAGIDAVAQVVESGEIDMVLSSLVGYAGVLPTINAIKAGKHIALANKETLVVAGELIMKLAIENKVDIIPVDSEHSAIFQCLIGEMMAGNKAEKIWLTASGGPFRGKTAEELSAVTAAQALKHPNWDMGAKVTIDSASLMNKGLEMIEAKWLFDVAPENIEVVVHPQSIVHSAVQFQDSSVKAQLGLPDMHLPIQYAMAFPHRLPSDFERFSFFDYPNLTFEKPNTEVFGNLNLAYSAISKGGNMPCIMNAANEIAVDAFLKGKTGFLKMTDLIADTMDKAAFVGTPSYSDYVETDAEARRIAEQLLMK